MVGYGISSVVVTATKVEAESGEAINTCMDYDSPSYKFVIAIHMLPSMQWVWREVHTSSYSTGRGFPRGFHSTRVNTVNRLPYSLACNRYMQKREEKSILERIRHGINNFRQMLPVNEGKHL